MAQIRALHQYDNYTSYLTHQAKKLDKIHDVLVSSYETHYPKLLKDRLTRYDDVQPGANVLCLAARLGGEVRAFQDLGCFAVGIDINPGTENQYVLHGDFHNIQFPDHSADVIFTNSLDHVLNFDKLIDQITRVLKHDGLLILEIVCGEAEGYIPEEYEVSIWQTIDDVLCLFLNMGYKIIGRHSFERPWRGEHISLVYKGEGMKDHREFLISLINERQFTTIAEVGVHRGATAEAILAHCPCVTDYYMIDPWCAYSTELHGVDTSSEWTQDEWDSVYKEVKQRVEPYKDRAHILRYPSCEAAKFFENDVLDLVFIDALHTEDAVDTDIQAWLPKVKPNGILAGHDWWDTGIYASKHAGVKKAVSAFFDTTIIHVGSPPESWGNVWYIDKAEWLHGGHRVVFCTENVKIAWALRPHVENLAEMIQGYWQAEIVDWDQRDALAQMPKSEVPTYIATFIGAKKVHEMWGISRDWIITGWHSIREIVRLDHRLRTGNDLSEKDTTDFLRTMDEDTYRVCDAFRELISQYAAVYCYNSRMVKIIGSDHITLLHPCVDVDTYKPSSLTNRKKLVVGWAGNTMREPHKKDIALLRQVINLVEKSPLLEFDYHACKGLRPDLPGLKKEEMPDFYKDLDVLIVTAVDEGTPRVVLEAGASGVPVVSTPCGIIPEYIIDGKTGYILDRNPTPKAFLDKLEYLATHRDMLNTMKSNIRTCTVADWSVGARRQAWLDLFERFPLSVTETWAQAAQKERVWWGDCTDTANEEAKQTHYASLMGLDTYQRDSKFYFASPFNMQGKSVLDLGGGPVSLLLKCENLGHATVLDPLEWPDWVLERYETAGIEYIQAMAENAHLDETLYDEVWIYNVLQHTQDPAQVLATAKKYGRVVRVFEWIDTPINDFHPHSLTREWLDQHLDTQGVVHENLGWGGFTGLPTAYTAIVHPEHRRLGFETQLQIKQRSPVFRCHLLGLAHVPTHRDVSACAYTQKVVKLAKMLKALGHTVYFYGGEGSSVECDEYIQVVSNQDRIDCYGDYDWHTQFFKHSGKDSCHATFNENTIREINNRKQERDFLLCPMGNYDKPIADAVGLTTVESGIGYRGVFAKYKVWESYAWMHYIYGMLKSQDGSWYDCVIPNYFDPADFPYQLEKDGYFLFIGRLVRRKGLDVAVQVTRELGARLIVAGQGWLVNKTEGLHITDSHVEHVGCVGPEERKQLMGRAKAVFVPTYYIEPFGGVAVEAQMCGTPVITTDWGAMTETILHGKTGYRCRTFDDFVWAAKNINQIHPADCHAWAVKNYSMSRVQQMYQKYLETLNDLHHKGWYELHPERTELDWLRKDYN